LLKAINLVQHKVDSTAVPPFACDRTNSIRSWSKGPRDLSRQANCMSTAQHCHTCSQLEELQNMSETMATIFLNMVVNAMKHRQMIPDSSEQPAIRGISRLGDFLILLFWLFLFERKKKNNTHKSRRLLVHNSIHLSRWNCWAFLQHVEVLEKYFDCISCLCFLLVFFFSGERKA